MWSALSIIVALLISRISSFSQFVRTGSCEQVSPDYSYCNGDYNGNGCDAAPLDRIYSQVWKTANSVYLFGGWGRYVFASNCDARCPEYSTMSDFWQLSPISNQWSLIGSNLDTCLCHDTKNLQMSSLAGGVTWTQNDKYGNSILHVFGGYGYTGTAQLETDYMLATFNTSASDGPHEFQIFNPEASVTIEKSAFVIPYRLTNGSMFFFSGCDVLESIDRLLQENCRDKWYRFDGLDSSNKSFEFTPISVSGDHPSSCFWEYHWSFDDRLYLFTTPTRCSGVYDQYYIYFVGLETNNDELQWNKIKIQQNEQMQPRTYPRESSTFFRDNKLWLYGGVSLENDILYDFHYFDVRSVDNSSIPLKWVKLGEGYDIQLSLMPLVSTNELFMFYGMDDGISDLLFFSSRLYFQSSFSNRSVVKIEFYDHEVIVEDTEYIPPLPDETIDPYALNLVETVVLSIVTGLIVVCSIVYCICTVAVCGYCFIRIANESDSSKTNSTGGKITKENIEKVELEIKKEEEMAKEKDINMKSLDPNQGMFSSAQPQESSVEDDITPFDVQIKEDRQKLILLLHELSLEEYIPAFKKSKIIYDDLPSLKQSDIEEVIPELVQRKRLLNYVKNNPEKFDVEDDGTPRSFMNMDIKDLM